MTSNKYKPASATKIYGWPTTIPSANLGRNGLAEEVSPEDAVGLWKEWFGSGGLFPAAPLEILRSPQCRGTWVARHGEAVAGCTLWDTSSTTRFCTTRIGWWAKLTNICMSLWRLQTREPHPSHHLTLAPLLVVVAPSFRPPVGCRSNRTP